MNYFYIDNSPHLQSKIQFSKSVEFKTIDFREGLNGDLITPFIEMISDFYIGENLIVSDEFYDILSVYQKRIKKRFIFLTEKKTKMTFTYWMIEPPTVKYVEEMFAKDRYNNQKQSNHFIKCLDGSRYIISEVIVESLLRHGMRGFEIKKIK